MTLWNMVNAHCADAMVCISNCDNITPGMLMAAMRLNITTIFVSGGPMEAGKTKLSDQLIRLDLVDAMIEVADPNVSDERIDTILKAALRAPDHGRMKHYHFVVIEKSGMQKFHECLKSAAIEFEMDEKNAAKADKLTNQAPMIIGVVAKLDHESVKVPVWEQIVCAGCATYVMQLAANAQGFDTVWITKKWVEGKAIREAFGCAETDKVIGLLMIGSPKDGEEIASARDAEDPTDFVHFIR